MSDREKAKKIILELIRQNGGVLRNKTNLYKAFYHAHIKYAADNPGLLSQWPIVRMPRGPGIHCGGILLGELVAEGQLQIHDVAVGKRVAMQFVLSTRAIESTCDLTAEELAAIQYGLSQVRGKTANQVSSDSHITSRCWNDATDGQELPIYTDLVDGAKYSEARTRAERAANILKRIG